MGRFVVLVLFAGLIALLASPLVAAPSVRDEARSGATVAVQRVNVPVRGLRDVAARVLVGTALFVWAGAVRRAA